MMKRLTTNEKKSFDSVSDSMPTSVKRQLVVLLMDPMSRRFELLQLELDSDKAVSDILAAISINVTDASLKNQQYDGVVDETGITMNECVRLVDFCKEKTVLVALHKGLSVKECVRLARVILCDKKIEKMLVGREFDTTGWNKKVEDSKSPGIVEEPSTASAIAASSRSGDKAFEKRMIRTITILTKFSLITAFVYPYESGDLLMSVLAHVTMIVGVVYIILFCLIAAGRVRVEISLLYGAIGVTLIYVSKLFLTFLEQSLFLVPPIVVALFFFLDLLLLYQACLIISPSENTTGHVSTGAIEELSEDEEIAPLKVLEAA